MASKSPPAKRIKLDYEETFDVLVGAEPNQHRFTVHKNQICARSRFFRACKSEAWCTDETKRLKPVDLGEDSPEVFSAYLACVYTRAVPPPRYTVQHLDSGDEPFHYARLDDRHLAELYVLADRLQDTTTANLVIDAIIKRSEDLEENPLISTCDYVYTNCPEGSPLRRLMVDYMVHESSISDATEETNPEFMADCLQEFMRVKMAGSSKWVEGVLFEAAVKKPKCHYHQHDEECPRCETST